MQNTKSIIIFLFIATLLVLGITFVSSHQSSPTTALKDYPAPDTTPLSDGTFTLAEVATHKDVKSCWTTIQGKVYNLTSWINQHPGGAEAILSLCGKDGTSLFLAQHSGQANPAAELKILYIGTLKN